jgi:hypothetical protein
LQTLDTIIPAGRHVFTTPWGANHEILLWCRDSAAERELQPGLLEKLRALNALDLELYEYALALAASVQEEGPL